jgi:hypothetical protein
MQSVAIVLICVGSAILYGILHDQITARVCVEYFTIGHPPVFGTEDPTLLAIGWGVIATWWGGALVGVPLALAARLGSRPKRSARSIVRPVCILFSIMAVSALLAGIIGWLLARQGMVGLIGSLAARVPPEKHVPFIADLWAHSASYFLGFVGGAVVVVSVWRSRRAGPPAA